MKHFFVPIVRLDLTEHFFFVPIEFFIPNKIILLQCSNYWGLGAGARRLTKI